MIAVTANDEFFFFFGIYIYIYIYIYICFVLGCAGSSLLPGLSLVAVRGGYSPVVVCKLLMVVASLVVALGCTGFSNCITWAK